VLEATKVGEVVSDVKSPIRGICTAILSPTTLHLIDVLDGKSCSGSDAGYKCN